jgi:hypothetical protein
MRGIGMSIDEFAVNDGIENPTPMYKAAMGDFQKDEPTPPRFQIPEFLKAPTGAGAVEDYINHPMNIKKNEHFARVLRGLTGMFNSLDYAIIDVVIGALGFMKKPPTGTV